ncbi:phosphoglycerate mutase-like protein AT74H [Nicotiana tabacum]|uniref:Phosphoglycerate mutase-like protein AT74H n=2 Tax=Nicotiana TaxID=4085 RepID=A0A1S3XDI8_TOBAC|nr:PREDICTED: broad-range acid phosphatase DET1-like [Nicotiana sylvestris]XP_016438005.1 PREDICTED: phosphoglycerate mutase-like protein AT74H [Nicotiana tabacum]
MSLGKKLTNGTTHTTCSNHLPKRIILVRHGECLANTDINVYGTTPNHKIELTQKGIEQAKQTGSLIKKLITSENAVESNNWKVFFYVSPAERTRRTLREIGQSFPKRKVMGVKEEYRLRELSFGNYHDPASIAKVKEERVTYGRFYYRVTGGETGAEVYDRISSFVECLRRDIEMKKFCEDPSQETNIIIVTHGLSSRIFLMKWFEWTIEQFEDLNRMRTCEFQVLQLGQGGEYSLAFHHDDKKLKEWGLSLDMIEDQKRRAYGPILNSLELCDLVYPYMDCFAQDSDEENTII